MLRAFVELVLNVVSTFQMKRNCPLRDWHTDQAQVSLPRTKSDTQQQETNSVAASDNDPIALMVSSTHSVRLSNHEGVLTASRSEPSGSVPLVRVPRDGGDPVPANKRAKRTESPCGFWTPAFAGDACASARQSARP